MDLFLLFIRVILTALFATAGIAKFADLKGSEKAFREFGVPAPLAMPSSIALSAAEIVIAGLFLFPETSWAAAVAAASLLSLFIIQMVYQRVKGKAPDCHCFGQLHSEPVGIKSILRNVVFLALTALLLYQGRNVQGLAMDQVTTQMMPTILGGLAVLMLGGALLYLRRIITTQEELKKRLDVLELLGRDSAPLHHEHASDPQQGLPIGAPLPDFEMPSVDGETFSLRKLLARGKPLLFFFVSTTCEPCQALLQEFVQWRNDLAERVTTVFISSGSLTENREKFIGLAGSMILIDKNRRFANSVGGRWTPTALFVDSNGNIASHIAAGDIAIDDLVERIKTAELTKPFTFFANAGHHGRGLKIGKDVPDFSLNGIDGRTKSKQDLLGKKTLVTFWSPNCPHCATMLSQLIEWEASRHNGDPDLLIISDGEIEQHRGLDLKAPVMIDKGYKTAAKLGMFGTPSAVLVNEDGVIATETAVGAANIWALIGRNNESD
jgi:peroxiredoxin